MKRIVTLALKIIGFFFGWLFLLFGLFSATDTWSETLLPPWERFVLEIIPLFCVVFVSLVFYLGIERGKMEIAGVKNLWRDLLLGTGVGVVWFVGVMGILFAFGTFRLMGKLPVELPWVWLLAVFCNAVFQEILIRGYLFQLLDEKAGFLWAVGITSLIFVGFHGGAIEAGIIPTFNVLAMSFFMSVLLRSTGNLIAPIMAHALWNGVGFVVGGVNLASDYPAFFESQLTGPTWISGGLIKFEGSIVTLFVTLSLIVLFLSLQKRNKIAA